MGLFDGFYVSLWCLGFSAMLFAGPLQVWMPAGLAVLLLGCGVVALVTAFTSQASLHLTGISRISVVILTPVAMGLAAHLGTGAGGPAGLATLLFIMALTSLLLGLATLLEPAPARPT